MIVADTNVLVYLYLDSPFTEAARQLHGTDPHWIAPMLWRSEMRNTLAQYIRVSDLTLAVANGIQDRVEKQMRGREFQVSSSDVLRLVNEGTRSAYDCEYIALAQSRNIPLISMDKKLVSCYPETARLLTDYVVI